MRHLPLLACTIAVLAACAPAAQQPQASSLYVVRTDPPAVVELDSHYRPQRELPLVVPAGCGLGSVYAAPRGLRLAIEFRCPFGEAVVWMDAQSGQLRQPVTSSDSHFLAWAPLGDALYLKVETVNRPHVVRADLDGTQQDLRLSELTYDLSPRPGGTDLLFAFSRGLGFGSELLLAGNNGASTSQIAADAGSYLSLARWSPDGDQIALIKIPDSATPFTIGGLWVMNADGTEPRQLARADGGHGFPPAWSPDGRQIAFVARENPDDPRADQSTRALISELHVVDLGNGVERALTGFDSARVEAPAWQPNGNIIAFTVVVNDRMTVYLEDALSGQLQQVDGGPVCCPAWLRR